jgi:NAD(P)-dependent dehydrogenase (short-subunit alcohol dehydrogenase family)
VAPEVSGYTQLQGTSSPLLPSNPPNTLRFLQAGASKVYITSRKADACESAVAALNALPNLAPGAKAISVPADSAKFEGVESLVKQVAETTDHVDILFANAGATWGAPFDEHPDAAFAKVMVSLFFPYYFARRQRRSLFREPIAGFSGKTVFLCST